MGSRIYRSCPASWFSRIAAFLLILALVVPHPLPVQADVLIENDDDAPAGSAAPLVCTPHPAIGILDQSRRPPEGSRLCTGFLMSRVPGDPAHKFDAALDVSVAVPPGRGPFPLLVWLHDWAGSKAGDVLTNVRHTEGDEDYRSLNDGIAVLRFSARGFGNSHGDTQIADEDFEIRDIQNMVRQVVEASGFASPPPFSFNRKKIAVTGFSYGAAQALMLAQTERRTWPCAPDTCELVTAVPVSPWTDLVYSLMPNGRPFARADRPGYVLGVEKLSYAQGLFFVGMQNAPRYGGSSYPPFYPRYHTAASAGEPYQDPETKAFLPHVGATLQEALRTLSLDRSPAYQDYCSSGPLPIFMIHAWTDDLFTAHEVLRFRNLVDGQCGRDYPLKVYMGNTGHWRARVDDFDELTHSGELTRDWLRYWLLGRGPRPSFDVISGVTAAGDTDFDPSAIISTKEFENMHRGDIVGKLTGGIKVTNSHGAPRPSDLSRDPVAGTLGAGKGDRLWGLFDRALQPVGPDAWEGALYSVPTDDIVPERATHRTISGFGTVRFTARIAGSDVVYVVRVWDLAPDGTRDLVDRGEFRFLGRPGTHTVTVPLHGNVWRLQPGRTLVVQITNTDLPYLRPNTLPSSTLITGATVNLPTWETGTLAFTAEPQNPDQLLSGMLGRVPIPRDEAPAPGAPVPDLLEKPRLPRLPMPLSPLLH